MAWHREVASCIEASPNSTLQPTMLRACVLVLLALCAIASVSSETFPTVFVAPIGSAPWNGECSASTACLENSPCELAEGATTILGSHNCTIVLEEGKYTREATLIAPAMEFMAVRIKGHVQNLLLGLQGAAHYRFAPYLGNNETMPFVLTDSLVTMNVVGGENGEEPIAFLRDIETTDTRFVWQVPEEATTQVSIVAVSSRFRITQADAGPNNSSQLLSSANPEEISRSLFSVLAASETALGSVTVDFLIGTQANLASSGQVGFLNAQINVARVAFEDSGVLNPNFVVHALTPTKTTVSLAMSTLENVGSVFSGILAPIDVATWTVSIANTLSLAGNSSISGLGPNGVGLAQSLVCVNFSSIESTISTLSINAESLFDTTKSENLVCSFVAENSVFTNSRIHIFGMGFPESNSTRVNLGGSHFKYEDTYFDSHRLSLDGVSIFGDKDITFTNASSRSHNARFLISGNTSFVDDIRVFANSLAIDHEANVQIPNLFFSGNIDIGQSSVLKSSSSSPLSTWVFEGQIDVTGSELNSAPGAMDLSTLSSVAFWPSSSVLTPGQALLSVTGAKHAQVYIGNVTEFISQKLLINWQFGVVGADPAEGTAYAIASVTIQPGTETGDRKISVKNSFGYSFEAFLGAKNEDSGEYMLWFERVSTSPVPAPVVAPVSTPVSAPIVPVPISQQPIVPQRPDGCTPAMFYPGFECWRGLLWRYPGNLTIDKPMKFVSTVVISGSIKFAPGGSITTLGSAAPFMRLQDGGCYPADATKDNLIFDFTSGWPLNFQSGKLDYSLDMIVQSQNCPLSADKIPYTLKPYDKKKCLESQISVQQSFGGTYLRLKFLLSDAPCKKKNAIIIGVSVAAAIIVIGILVASIVVARRRGCCKGDNGDYVPLSQNPY